MKKKPNPTAIMAKATKALHSKKADLPPFEIGDTLKIYVKVTEGEKTRVQVYEGLVIGQKRGGANASFTVRKISYGVGVERIFPFYSPVIEKIAVVSKGEVRRAKLYYLRALSGRASRIKSELVYGDESSGSEEMGGAQSTPKAAAQA